MPVADPVLDVEGFKKHAVNILSLVWLICNGPHVNSICLINVHNRKTSIFDVMSEI